MLVQGDLLVAGDEHPLVGEDELGAEAGPGEQPGSVAVLGVAPVDDDGGGLAGPDVGHQGLGPPMELSYVQHFYTSSDVAQLLCQTSGLVNELRPVVVKTSSFPGINFYI